jgi:hypothetical protein
LICPIEPVAASAIGTNLKGNPYAENGFQGSFFKLVRRLTKQGGGWRLVFPSTVFAIPSAANLPRAAPTQRGSRRYTRHLVYDAPSLIEFTTSYYSLHPGDIIMTGTPSGVGPVKPGDLMTVEIERIGRMDVRIRAALNHNEGVQRGSASAK